MGDKECAKDPCVLCRFLMERCLVGASGDVLVRAVEEISCAVKNSGWDDRCFCPDGAAGVRCKLLTTAF
ncbi:MAG: hypothetical protein LBI39_01805 [Puniceicoccales bacterium]|nr:hypothetical protein [Puniceicoccales bacterium]